MPPPKTIDVLEVEAVLARIARNLPKSVSTADKQVLSKLEEGL